MDSITFQATVNDEQVIRPPTDVQLPFGILEVTIRAATQPATRTSTASANDRLRRCRVSTGGATGIDNESIDAELARIYGRGTHSVSTSGSP